MVESEFVLPGTEIDDNGIPCALLARERDGDLEFAGPAILRPPSHAKAEWADKFAAMSLEKPALKGLRRANKAKWLRPAIKVRTRHLKAKEILRHATMKEELIEPHPHRPLSGVPGGIGPAATFFLGGDRG